MSMIIHPEIKQACQEVLDRSYQNGRFTQREFGQLDQIISWFDKPDNQLQFSFLIALSNNGESTHFSIEFDGVTLGIDETNTTYDKLVGSDHFTSYKFSLSPDKQEEEGDLNGWKTNALDALRFVNDSSIKVGFSINVED